MMKTGIPLRECDRTELGMYLRILKHAARRDEDREPAKRGKVVELKRGTIDEFW